MGKNKLGELPGNCGLFQLKGLMILDLCENDLSEIPSQISKLSELKTLNLANNLLRTLVDEIGLIELDKLLIEGIILTFFFSCF